MKPIVLLFLLLFVVGQADNKPQEFKLPEGRRVNVHHALEEYKVPDDSRVLTEQEKHSLCRMFVKAYTMEGKSYSSFPYLTTKAPIYKLLLTNFPDIKSRAGEAGQLIRLRDIARYFNSLSDYRGDVVKVLEEQKPDASCK